MGQDWPLFSHWSWILQNIWMQMIYLKRFTEQWPLILRSRFTTPREQLVPVDHRNILRVDSAGWTHWDQGGLGKYLKTWAVVGVGTGLGTPLMNFFCDTHFLICPLFHYFSVVFSVEFLLYFQTSQLKCWSSYRPPCFPSNRSPICSRKFPKNTPLWHIYTYMWLLWFKT